MNKKLLTLAVAAALAAPAIASAEAIMYGKLNVSLDYETIDNQIVGTYNNSATSQYSYLGLNIPAYAGDDIYVRPDGVIALRVPANTNLNQAQVDFLRASGGAVRVAPGGYFPGQNFNGWGMSKSNQMQGEGRASRFGIKGSEDLGNGLKAVYQVEVGINFDTNNNITGTSTNPDPIYLRNTFAGLAGDWGTILMGRHDTPLKISTAKLDLFSDTMADYNGTIGFQDLRVDNAVAYISPSWSGFQLALATVPAGMSTAGYGQNINSDQINGAWSAAGIYKNGPFYGSVAYESIDEEMGMNTANSLNGCLPVTANVAPGFGTVTTYTCNKAEDSFNKWRVGLGLLDWNGFTLTGIYENQENLPTSDRSVAFSDPRLAGLSWNLPSGPEDRELWQIQAGYAFGNFMLKAMYGQTTFSGDYTAPQLGGFGETSANMAVYNNMLNDGYSGNTSSWAIGADYNFSKRTSAYVLYTATTSDYSDIPGLSDPIGNAYTATTVSTARPAATAQWDGFSIGMMHSF